MHLLDAIRMRSDSEVVGDLDDLADTDRKTGAGIVAHLVVVKERSIHLDMAYSSIVDYCVDRLGCSSDVAYKRAAAVKVAEAHPEVLAWLADGDITASGLVVLAPHRDDKELVFQARGQTKRQIQKLVAKKHPKPDSPRIQFRVRPVADGLSKIEMIVPDELVNRIDEALDLDSHIDPSRDRVAVVCRALDVYVEKRKREREKVTDRPRAESDQPTQAVPAAKVRKAYEQSGGQCQYVSPDGRRCTARAFLEVDHVLARARGGGHDQLRILCWGHNQHAAQNQLGKTHMENARRRAQLVRDLAATLKQLGFSPKVAGAAAEGSVESLGADAELEPLVKQALQHASSASRPKASTAREPAPSWCESISQWRPAKRRGQGRARSA